MIDKKLSDVSAELKKPFPELEISVRVGGTFPGRDGGRTGIALPYIDARQVMERLDNVVGPDNWSDDYQIVNNTAVLCRLTVLGVTKSDAGQSKEDAEDKGEAKDLKSAVSDAFKRAAVKFGIGQFLYSLPRQYEDIDDKKHFKRKPELIVHDIMRKSGLLQSTTKTVVEETKSVPKVQSDIAPDPVSNSDVLSQPQLPAEEKTTDDFLTADQIVKMQELKAKLKIKDNIMLNPYVKDWLQVEGKEVEKASFRDLNRRNIDGFVSYLKKKTNIQ